MSDWVDIAKDGPPPNWSAAVMKPVDMGWLVYDGNRIHWCTVHPSYWNHIDERGRDYDGPKVTHWAEFDPPQDTSPIDNLKGLD